MKKNITLFCLIGSLLIILDTIGAWHMLMMFLFVGIIPGTNIALSPSLMLILMSFLTGLVISVAFILPYILKNGYFKQITIKSQPVKYFRPTNATLVK